jgi:hypothetical protein
MSNRARRPHLFTYLISLSLCLGLSVAAAPVQAELLLGADLDYALPLDSAADSGGGFAVRVGYQVHVPFAVLTSELAFNYENFSGTLGPTADRGLAGLRLGLGEVFRIGPSAHIGVGRLAIDGGLATIARTGFTYDVGLFLDFTAIPILNVGVHAAYNQMPDGGGQSFQWMTFGAHVELIL